MHEEIKRYGLDGIVGADVDTVAFKDSMTRHVETWMREDGFAPALDIEAQYSQEYDAEQNHFTFRLSVYGLYVGEEEAWRVAGVMNGRTILKSIPQTK